MKRFAWWVGLALGALLLVSHRRQVALSPGAEAGIEAFAEDRRVDGQGIKRAVRESVSRAILMPEIGVELPRAVAGFTEVMTLHYERYAQVQREPDRQLTSMADLVVRLHGSVGDLIVRALLLRVDRVGGRRVTLWLVDEVTVVI